MRLVPHGSTPACLALLSAICCLPSLSGCAQGLCGAWEKAATPGLSCALLGVRVATKVKGGHPRVTVTVVNNHSEALYVPTADWGDWEEKTGKGPYVFLGGPHTLVLYWGDVSDPEGFEWGYAGPPMWRPVQRIEPGGTCTFAITLRSTIYSNKHVAFPLDGGCLYAWPIPCSSLQATRVVAIVGYWQEQVLLAMDEEFANTKVTVTAVRNKVQGRIPLSSGPIYDPERLPAASYAKVLTDAIYQQNWKWMPVEGMGVQLFAVSQPQTLPQAITVTAF